MKKFCFGFSEIPVTNGTAFSGVSRKEENLSRYTQIFGNFSPGISVPFDFPPGIFG